MIDNIANLSRLIDESDFPKGVKEVLSRAIALEMAGKPISEFASLIDTYLEEFEVENNAHSD